MVTMFFVNKGTTHLVELDIVSVPQPVLIFVSLSFVIPLGIAQQGAEETGQPLAFK